MGTLHDLAAVAERLHFELATQEVILWRLIRDR
jgi:hypothetical protein